MRVAVRFLRGPPAPTVGYADARAPRGDDGGEFMKAEERKVKFAHDNAANFSRRSGNCLRPVDDVRARSLARKGRREKRGRNLSLDILHATIIDGCPA